MYFFSDDERKYLLKKLLPKARETDISEDLRGWNWHTSELSPPHEITLPIWEVAGKYCETGRDVYLRHVQGVKVEATKEMISGRIYHSVVSALYPAAKKFIYTNGLRACSKLRTVLSDEKFREAVFSEEALTKFTEEEVKELKGKVEKLWIFEVNSIISKIDETLGKYRYLSEDSLINHAIPVVLEHKLNGKYLGLSGNLSADAINFAGVVISDLKTGDIRDFHKLSTTGYALVYESLYEVPVSIGCTIYLSFPKNHPTPHIEKKFYLITDELRQWFIEERDEKQDIIFYEKDPGKCSDPKGCRYREHCF